jgi:hypothetical protein
MILLDWRNALLLVGVFLASCGITNKHRHEMQRERGLLLLRRGTVGARQGRGMA